METGLAARSKRNQFEDCVLLDLDVRGGKDVTRRDAGDQPRLPIILHTRARSSPHSHFTFTHGYTKYIPINFITDMIKRWKSPSTSDLGTTWLGSRIFAERPMPWARFALVMSVDIESPGGAVALMKAR